MEHACWNIQVRVLHGCAGPVRYTVADPNGIACCNSHSNADVNSNCNSYSCTDADSISDAARFSRAGNGRCHSWNFGSNRLRYGSTGLRRDQLRHPSG